MGKKLTKLFEMIEEIETAMMTTRRKDGHLVSRAMATQKRAPGADVWFVTDESSEKLEELEFDQHVNLSFYKDRTREWVSISGIATVTRDRKKIRQLYAEDWRAWFPEEGDERHGTPDDPRMVLIGVKIHTGFYLEVNKPQPVILFELLKGMITKEAPKLGEVKGVDGRGRSRKAESASTKSRSSSRGSSRSSGSASKSAGARSSGTKSSGTASSRGTTSRTSRPAAAGASRSKASSRKRAS